MTDPTTTADAIIMSVFFICGAAVLIALIMKD
jgi:hypothetical protein